MGYDISIVIPLYNKRGEIARCLNSVRAQNLENFEVVIVNDGSTDDGPVIAASFCDVDRRIQLHHQPNSGVAAARNRGVELASAPLVAFLDADDELLPHHLSTFTKLGNQYPEAGMLFSCYWIDRGQGWRRRVRVPRRFLSHRTRLVSNYFALPDGCIQTCSVVVRKERYLAVGGERKMYAEDIDMAFRMAAAFPVAYSPTPTSVWHVDAGSLHLTKLGASPDLRDISGLGASLKQTETDATIPSLQKLRAQFYVAKRERKAIIDTVLAGNCSAAASLYAAWRERFNQRSRMVQFLLRLPSPALSITKNVTDQIRRTLTIAAYLRETPASVATFKKREQMPAS